MRVDNKDKSSRRANNLNSADTALFLSALLLVEVLRSQNVLFALNLDGEIQDTENAIAKVWKEAIDAKSGRGATITEVAESPEGPIHD